MVGVGGCVSEGGGEVGLLDRCSCPHSHGSAAGAAAAVSYSVTVITVIPQRDYAVGLSGSATDSAAQFVQCHRNHRSGRAPMKISLVVGSALALAMAAWNTVAHSAEPVLYQVVNDHKPEVGVSVSVFLGDRMLEQRQGQYRDCIVPKFSNKQKMNLGAASFVIRAGEPACKMNASDRYYTPNYINWEGGRDVRQTYPLSVTEEVNQTLTICIVSMGFKSGCQKGKTKEEVSYGPVFLYTPHSLQQTIEYAGKSGSVLKFIYSEFMNGMARGDFTREFQVDTSEGNLVAYKGAVLEIVSATNAQVTYKVVRNFQS